MTEKMPDTMWLAYWCPMDENGGTAYDGSGYPIFTQHGVTIPRSGGKVGYSRNFERDSTHYMTGVSLVTHTYVSFTIGMWIRPESIGNIMTIMFGSDCFRLRITATGILEASINDWLLPEPGEFHVWQTAAWGTPLVPATWYFVVAYYDGSTQTINLSVNNETPVSNGYINNGDNYAETLYLGSNSGTSQFYDGKIDEVFMYHGVLTEDERSWFWNSGAGRSYYDMMGVGFITMF